MANLIVHGGTPLAGRIVPSANKNAVLPILCATLLTREPVRLLGITDITDVRKILEVFRQLGSQVEVDFAKGVLDLHHAQTKFDPKRASRPGTSMIDERISCGRWCCFGSNFVCA